MRGTLLAAVLVVIFLGMAACPPAQAHGPYGYGYGYGGYGYGGYSYYSPPVYRAWPQYHPYPMPHFHYTFQRVYYPRYPSYWYGGRRWGW